MINVDAFVKSRKTPFSVIPAKAGIQEKQALLDPGFRRGDGFDDFLRERQCSMLNVKWKLGFLDGHRTRHRSVQRKDA